MEPKKPTVVCIIGSSRFKDHHLGHAQRFTLAGKIVLVAGFFHHVDRYPITDAQKKQIDELCLRKIDLADEVYVVNINGYIGESTSGAIEYAKELGKPVTYMEPPG